ncbi:hypothetical protein J3459_022256 [Metarhizium acridum]|nr:hypothetical protein J3459_022256 [Metarhizium acridum]
MPGKIRTAQKVSFDVPAGEQPGLHNRWHPAVVPSIGTIKRGETVKIECLDWTGGQIGNNDSADDVRNVDLTKIHYLTGPFDVEGAEPGDLVVVNITDIQPFDSTTLPGASRASLTATKRRRLPRPTLPARGKGHLGL